MTGSLKEQIKKLKNDKNAIILAHFYQDPEIQDLADFRGDSLELSRKASETDASIIVFAGVHFMAETAKILNPRKKVLLPDLDAGCSLADGCSSEDFKRFLQKYPDHVVVSYINCSAEIKAMSDYICTSSNALKIINSLSQDAKIVFAPDRNLGEYLIKASGRDMVLWDGTCEVHEAFSLEKLLKLKAHYSDAEIIAHPESETQILDHAEYIGSTSKMLSHVQESENQTFIIATEAGILHEMAKRVPGKTLIPAPAYENNSCACSECRYMKKNTVLKLYQCLLHEKPEIVLDEWLLKAAYAPIARMLEYG